MSLVARAAASIASTSTRAIMACCPLPSLFIIFSRRHSIYGALPLPLCTAIIVFLLPIACSPSPRGFRIEEELLRRYSHMGLWIADGHLCVAVPPCQRSLAQRLDRMQKCREMIRSSNDGVHPNISSETSLLSWSREKLHRAGQCAASVCSTGMLRNRLSDSRSRSCNWTAVSAADMYSKVR